jgi:trehalose 6-phosphate synthase
MQMPWRTEIIEGLLGADLVGFHLPGGAQNFMILARRLVGANTSRATVGVRSRFGDVQVGFRNVKVGAFPISIDSAELDRKARDRGIRQRAREIRAEMGNPRKVLLGVDRLDYTKGIRHRLKAVGELFEDGRLTVPGAVLVQVASPSRERVEQYRRCARTSSVRSATSTASTARWATRWCTTCTGRFRAMSWSLSSSPQTSCW